MTSGSAPAAGTTPKILRLRIVRNSDDHPIVALTLPITMIGVAQRLGAHILPPDVTVDSVIAQAEHEGVAQLAWANDDRNERLELMLE